MIKEDFVYIPKVDSGKISIQLSKCEIIHEMLNDMMNVTYTSISTGEVYDEEKISGKPFTLENKKDGTYARVWVEPQMNYVNGKAVSEMFVSILINSKHLHKNYFKGITKNTLFDLYTYIMSLNLFKCSYNDFQYSRFNDVDICFDFIATKVNFEVLKRNIKLSVKDEKKWHTKTSKSNTGLYATSARAPRTHANPSNPYIKIYDKELDLEVRSKNFADTYLKEIDYRDLIRYECTIKSRKHLKRLGLENVKTFWELLDCDLSVVCGQMFREYFHKPKIIKVGNIKPMEKVIIDFINLCIAQGVPRYEIFKIFDRDDVSRQSKSDLIKKYHGIMQRDEINKEELQSNEITKNLFQYLGVDMKQLQLDFNKEKDKETSTKKKGNT